MFAATLKAAQKMRLTHPQKATKLLLIPLKQEKTAPMDTAPPSPNPECRTTAAGDTEVDSGSALHFIRLSRLQELCLFYDVPLDVQGSQPHSLSHTVVTFTLTATVHRFSRW